MNSPSQRVQLKPHDIRQFCGEIVRERRGEISKQTTDMRERIDKLYALLSKNRVSTFLEIHRLDPIMSREEDAKKPPSAAARSGRRRSLLTKFETTWPGALNKQGHGYMLDQDTQNKMVPTPEEMVEAVRRAMHAVAPGLDPKYFDIPVSVNMFGDSVQIDLELLQQKGATQRIVEERSDAIAAAVQGNVPAEIVLDFQALADYYDAAILVAEQQAATALSLAQRLRALRDALPVGPSKMRLPKIEPPEVEEEEKEPEEIFAADIDLEEVSEEVVATENGFRNAKESEQQAYLTSLLQERSKTAPTRTIRVLQFIMLRPSHEEKIKPKDFNPYIVEPGTDHTTMKGPQLNGPRKSSLNSVTSSFPDLLDQRGIKRGTHYIVNIQTLSAIYLGFVTWAEQNSIEINTADLSADPDADLDPEPEEEVKKAPTVEEAAAHLGFRAPTNGRVKRALQLLLESYPDPLDTTKDLQARLGAQDLMSDGNWGLYVFMARGGANRFGIAGDVIPPQ
jgi:hypothetical protein